jgi:hypothetical protein
MTGAFGDWPSRDLWCLDRAKIVGWLFRLTSATPWPSLSGNMNLRSSLKHFVLAFLLAALCYAVFYKSINERRHRNGPWQLTFTANALNNTPLLVINQPKLAIKDVEINFLDETNPLTDPVMITLREPQPLPYPVPFGQCTAMDIRFLPGTAAFQLYGHKIELRPRALIIDQQEHPWSSDRFNLHSIHPETATRR